MRWKITKEGKNRYATIYTPVETRYIISPAPNSFTELEAIMMDMDGSSTDTEKLVLEAMRQMLAEELGDKEFRFAKDDFPHIIGDSTTNHIKYLLNKYRLAPDRLERCIETYYQKYHQTLFDIRDGKITDHLIEPMPGLKEFLLHLKKQGIKIGLVTSSLGEELDLVLDEVFKRMGMPTPFREFYDGVIVAEEAGESFLKPHPNLYIRIAEEKLFIKDKSKCFVIEDSTAGILAARIAGFAVTAVPHHGTKDHNFELANLGLSYGGLPEIMEKNLFLSFNFSPK